MLTVPNALSMLRLVLIPLFVWLVVFNDAPGWGVVVLVVAGISDFLDGFLARRWNQVSAIGTFLDPLADRVTSVVVPVVLAVVHIIPWWLVVALLARDVVVFVALAQLRRTGQLGLPVTFVGKAATFALLMGFPFLLLGGEPGGATQWSTVLGWLLTVIGLGLYWWSAVVYLGQVRSLTRSNP
ncbi:MAG: hypothetical protein F2872_00225 [Actinobacteria bacterium]|nr:hypothetical protein [Actinomycetota bacterium]